MPQQIADQRTSDLSTVFHALSDPTRRDVVERLGTGPTGTSELAVPYGMALPSFLQHMGVLEAAGVVRSHKDGRVRTYHVVPGTLSAVDGWMAAQRRTWETRLAQFDEYVRRLDEGNA